MESADYRLWVGSWSLRKQHQPQGPSINFSSHNHTDAVGQESNSIQQLLPNLIEVIIRSPKADLDDNPFAPSQVAQSESRCGVEVVRGYPWFQCQRGRGSFLSMRKMVVQAMATNLIATTGSAG